MWLIILRDCITCNYFIVYLIFREVPGISRSYNYAVITRRVKILDFFFKLDFLMGVKDTKGVISLDWSVPVMEGDYVGI